MVKIMTQNDNSFDPRLKRHLELLREIPPRDSEASKRGKENFLQLAASLPKPVSMERSGRLNNWIISIKRKKERHTMFTITTLVIVLTMLFGGAGATVYAAQDSMPDEALYAVKTWSEDIQMGLTNNPEVKFDLIESYVLRRFAELDAMIEDEDPIPPGLGTRLEQQLKNMEQLMAQLKDEDLEPYLLRVRNLLQVREQLMTKQGENVPEWANPVFAQIQQMITNQLRRIETGIDDPLKFRQQMDSPAGGYGPGPGTGSGNPEEEFIPPAGPGEEMPPGPVCDPEIEDCGQGEPQYQAPSEPAKNSGDQDNYQQQEGTPQKEKDSGNGNGGKP
jgi:hypothetical protein